MTGRQEHEGEPKLPLNVVLYALFLLLRGGLLLFLSTVTLSRRLGDPHPGSKSKRIFLSADLLLRKRSNQWVATLR